MASPALRAAGTENASQSGTTWTLETPTGAVAGDVVYAVIRVDGDLTGSTPSWDAGWTVLRSTESSFHGLSLYHLVRTLTGSDDMTIVFGGANTGRSLTAAFKPASDLDTLALGADTDNNGGSGANSVMDWMDSTCLNAESTHIQLGWNYGGFDRTFTIPSGYTRIGNEFHFIMYKLVGGSTSTETADTARGSTGYSFITSHSLDDVAPSASGAGMGRGLIMPAVF